MQIVIAIGPYIVDELFDKVDITHLIPPSDTTLTAGSRLYKIQLQPIVVAAAGETWEKVRDLLKTIARDGWEATKVKFDSLMKFISDRTRELGSLAEEYEQLLLEKLHELMRNTSELLLKSINQQIQIGRQIYTLNSVNLETKLLFTGSIEASVATIGKLLGTGEVSVTGIYSIPGSPTSGESTS
jgi:hypothetical protein